MYCSLVLERTSVASFNKLLSFWVCKLSWLAGSKAPKDRIRQNLLGLSLLSPTRAGTFFSNDLTFEILSRQLPVHFLRSISIFYIKMSSVDLFYHLTLCSKRAKLIIEDLLQQKLVANSNGFLSGLLYLSWQLLFAYMINHLKLQKSSHSKIQWTDRPHLHVMGVAQSLLNHL